MNPKIVNVGAGVVLATKTDFINGYRAGHLAFMAERTTHNVRPVTTASPASHEAHTGKGE